MTKIEIALMILGVSATIAIIRYYSRKKEEAKWNQGYCVTCGEEWEYYGPEPDGKKLYRCANNHFLHISFDGIDS